MKNHDLAVSDETQLTRGKELEAFEIKKMETPSIVDGLTPILIKETINSGVTVLEGVFMNIQKSKSFHSLLFAAMFIGAISLSLPNAWAGKCVLNQQTTTPNSIQCPPNISITDANNFCGAPSPVGFYPGTYAGTPVTVNGYNIYPCLSNPAGNSGTTPQPPALPPSNSVSGAGGGTPAGSGSGAGSVTGSTGSNPTVTGNNQTGNNQTGNNQTGNNQTGNNQTGNNQTGNNQTGNNQPVASSDSTNQPPAGSSDSSQPASGAQNNSAATGADVPGVTCGDNILFTHTCAPASVGGPSVNGGPANSAQQQPSAGTPAGQSGGSAAQTGNTSPDPATQTFQAANTAQTAATNSNNDLDTAQANENAACSGPNADPSKCELAGNVETQVENNNNAIQAAAKQAIGDTGNPAQNSQDAQTQAQIATNTLTNSNADLKVTPDVSAPTGGSSSGSGGQAGQGGQQQNNQDQAKDQNFQADSNCKYSNQFGAGNNCKSTSTLMTTTQIMVAGGQMAGSATLNTMGQQAQQNMMVNGATQAQMYQSGIDMTKDAAKAQLALGSAQLVMGYLIHNKAKTAATNATNLEGVKFTSGSGTQCTNGNANCVVVNSGSINAQKAATAYNNNITNGDAMTATSGSTAVTGNAVANQATANTLAANGNKLSQAAYTEQNNLHEAASTSALTNMITGGQALLSGMLAWRNADAEQALLNKLENAPVAAAPSADPFNTLSSSGSGTTITGNGITGNGQQSAAAAASPNPMPSAPLGNALGGMPDNDLAAAPVTPTDATPNPDAEVPGGAGMGGGAIGTSAAPPGSDAEPQAKYADNGRGVAAYESAGIAAPGGAGGKGSSGSGGDSAINPKDLLAAMMDQMNGKKEDPAGDILAYGRNPASEAPFAPLPSSEEMFGYIHKAYQGLQRKGRVGLN